MYRCTSKSSITTDRVNSVLADLIRNKTVLFITTKNIDYIRNVQEIAIIRKHALKPVIIGSDKKNYPARMWDIWKKIRRNEVKNADVVFLGFAPQLILPFIQWRIKEKTVIIDFFISIYDTLVFDRKRIRDGTIAARICYKLDALTLKKADYVITDTNAHRQYFTDTWKCNPNKFETVYLEADKKIYYPRPPHKPSHLKDRFIILYFGSILPLQGVEVVMDAIRRFKDDNRVYFDIIGPVKKDQCPIQDNVCYTNWLSQEALSARIANADLCLAGHFSANIEKANRTIPGKAFIYEAMKKRMILGDSLANREVFHENSYHMYIRRGKASQLVRAIRDAMETTSVNK